MTLTASNFSQVSKLKPDTDSMIQVVKVKVLVAQSSVVSNSLGPSEL